MTERKPPGITWDTWIDRLINEGQARGAFDNNPLVGKPIPGLDKPRDEEWWTKQLMQREGIVALPKTLQVRKELDQALADIATADSEAEVREIVERINARIREVNRMAASGPPSNMMPLDLERVVATWESGRR